MEIAQKERMFYLIEKYLDSNQPLIKKLINKIKHIVKITQEELYELIELITNQNPYIETFEKVSLKYEPSSSKKDRMIASYSSDIDQISFYSNFVNKMLYGKFLFADLIDAISHEQRHHIQDLFIRKLTAKISFEKKLITDFNKYELMTKKQYSYIVNYLNNEESLFTKNPILDKKALVKNKYLPEFQGAYLSLEHEKDAFKTGYKNTRSFFHQLTKDPQCPDKLKTKLEEEYFRYRKSYHISRKNHKKYMKSFEELKTNLTNKVTSTLNADFSSLKTFEIENTCSIIFLCYDVMKDRLTLENKIKSFNFFISNHHLAGKQFRIKKLHSYIFNSLTEEEKKVYKNELFLSLKTQCFTKDVVPTIFEELLLISTKEDTNNLTNCIYSLINNASLETITEILTQTINYENINLDKIATKIEIKIDEVLEEKTLSKQQLNRLKTIVNLLLAQASKSTIANQNKITHLLEKINNYHRTEISVYTLNECALKL